MIALLICNKPRENHGEAMPEEEKQTQLSVLGHLASSSISWFLTSQKVTGELDSRNKLEKM